MKIDDENLSEEEIEVLIEKKLDYLIQNCSGKNKEIVKCCKRLFLKLVDEK